MKDSGQKIHHVSDTAYWVATHRMDESAREDALFRDPLAKVLVGEYGQKITESMKSVTRFSYWSVIMRTCVIDRFILAAVAQGYQTILNIGAGLDTRPYRLKLPNTLQWIEIDFPEMIALKNEKLKNEVPICQLQRIGLDLANKEVRSKTLARLNRECGKTLILTEGVIPYLSEAAVAELASELRDQANFELWITEYYSPEVYRVFQSPQMKRLLGDSPFVFFPKDWFGFFRNCGWQQKEICYLFDEGKKHDRQFPLPWFPDLLRKIFGEEFMAKRIRQSFAYVVFEKDRAGK